MKRYLSTGDTVILTITLFLFIIAIFTEGFIHNLSLEAGILLVSIKVIMIGYKIKLSNNVILKELEDIKKTLLEIKSKDQME